MMRPRLVVLAVVAAGLLSSAAGIAGRSPSSRALYVDPQAGGDDADGRSARAEAGSGPFRTIARAIAAAGPGDTIHLAPATYTESAEFRNKSGEPGHPITLDGHGAVLDGSEPLVESDWRQVSPGLYRNAALYRKAPLSGDALVGRLGFVFDGNLNRMGRSSKGRSAPFKSPADLRPGEWTYQAADDHAYFLRIDPNRTLASYRVRVPTRLNGTQIWGNVSHVVIKNLTARHALNDGFGLSSGFGLTDKVRDISYENIKAFQCCDDGMSAHSDCELKVEGFEVDGCATGVANVGTSVIDRLVTRNVFGVDLYFLGGRHVLRNSLVGAHGNLAAVRMHTMFGNAAWLASPSHGALPEGWDRCRLELENVVIDGSELPDRRPGRVLVEDRSSLAADRTTINGLSMFVSGGGSLRLTRSLVLGGRDCEIDLKAGSSWFAEDNVYDIGRLRIETEVIRRETAVYSIEDFPNYQSASGQDSRSRARSLDFRKWKEGENGREGLPRDVGAARPK